MNIKTKIAWFKEASSNRAERVHVKAFMQSSYRERDPLVCQTVCMRGHTLTRLSDVFTSKWRGRSWYFEWAWRDREHAALHRKSTVILASLGTFSGNATRLILSNDNNYILLLLRAVFESDPRIPQTRAAKTNLLSTFFILLLSACMRCLFQVQQLQSEDESPSGNEEEVEKITLKCLGWCAFAKFPPPTRRGTTPRGETTCFLVL